MSVTFQTQISDCGVALDNNYMQGLDKVQVSTHFIALTPSNWTISDIDKIIVTMRGSAVANEYTGSAITAATSGVTYDPSSTNADKRTFLNAQVFNTIPNTKAAVLAAKTADTINLNKYVKLSPVTGGQVGIFLQGSGITDGSGTQDPNTMVGSVTIQVTAANNAALTSKVTSTPISVFDAAGTARAGSTTTL